MARVVMGAIGLAMVLTLVGLWLRRDRGASVSSPPRTESLPDIAATLSLADANARALELVAAGQAYESIPYFRRQLAFAGDAWALRKDFATALHNAAIESGPRGPVTRSSAERVQLVRAALDELAAAERLADSEQARTAVLEDRAHTLAFWGFPLDAAEILRAIVARDAASPGAVAELAELERRLARPLNAER